MGYRLEKNFLDIMHEIYNQTADEMSLDRWGNHFDPANAKHLPLIEDDSLFETKAKILSQYVVILGEQLYQTKHGFRLRNRRENTSFHCFHRDIAEKIKIALNKIGNIHKDQIEFLKWYLTKQINSSIPEVYIAIYEHYGKCSESVEMIDRILQGNKISDLERYHIRFELGRYEACKTMIHESDNNVAIHMLASSEKYYDIYQLVVMKRLDFSVIPKEIKVCVVNQMQMDYSMLLDQFSILAKGDLFVEKGKIPDDIEKLRNDMKALYHNIQMIKTLSVLSQKESGKFQLPPEVLAKIFLMSTTCIKGNVTENLLEEAMIRALSSNTSSDESQLLAEEVKPPQTGHDQDHDQKLPPSCTKSELEKARQEKLEKARQEKLEKAQQEKAEGIVECEVVRERTAEEGQRAIASHAEAGAGAVLGQSEHLLPPSPSPPPLPLPPLSEPGRGQGSTMTCNMWSLFCFSPSDSKAVESISDKSKKTPHQL